MFKSAFIYMMYTNNTSSTSDHSITSMPTISTIYLTYIYLQRFKACVKIAKVVHLNSLTYISSKKVNALKASNFHFQFHIRTTTRTQFPE